MGYNISYKGTFRFKEELTDFQIEKLEELLDSRLDSVWSPLWFNKNRTGLEYSGAEKATGMDIFVKALIREMKKDFPNFGLEGRIYGQGESFGHLFYIEIKDNKIEEVDLDVYNLASKDKH